MEKLLFRPALGQEAQLGDLYDARTATFSGQSLFVKSPPLSAIRVQDLNFSGVNFVNCDSYQEKFSMLEVKGDLALRVLSGAFTVNGSAGSFLRDNKTNARSVKTTLMFSLKTKLEELNLFKPEMKKVIDFKLLKVTPASHVVVQIEFGAHSFLSVEMKTEQTTIAQIQEAIRREIFLSVAHDGRGDELAKQRDASVKVYSDIFSEQKPRTIGEAVTLLKDVPNLMETINYGKGKPLVYTLLPLTALRSHFKLDNSQYSVSQFDDEIVLYHLKTLDYLNDYEQMLNDLVIDGQYRFLSSGYYELSRARESFKDAESNFRLNLTRLLNSVFMSESGCSELAKLRDHIKNQYYPVEEFGSKVRQMTDKIEDEKFFDFIKSSNVKGCWSIEYGVSHCKHNDVYILLYNKQVCNENRGYWQQIQHVFKCLARESVANKKFDCLYSKSTSTPDSKVDGTNIVHYKNGKPTTEDVLLAFAGQSCASPSQDKKKSNESHSPGVLGGHLKCGTAAKNWLCFSCLQPLEHVGNHFVTCGVGAKVEIVNTEHEDHNFSDVSKKDEDSEGVMPMQVDVPFDPTPTSLPQTSNKIEESSGDVTVTSIYANKQSIKISKPKRIKYKKEVNILILGETGVGKSTFINAFCNYLKFSSMTEALSQDELFHLIASKFTVLDENFMEQVIEIGSDVNENLVKTGQSATQTSKAYAFAHGDTLIRLIDTPGIGDSRGTEQDSMNFDNILAHLSSYDEVHGICILLKPNNARLGVLFRFCINELLTHLHKDACHNLVFCFTHSRSTSYRPGDTFGPLKEFVSGCHDVEIKLSRNTVYCMDNESFRFMVEVKKGIKHNEIDQKNYETSWDKSVNETERLVNYVMSLSPHKIKNTISLNDARRTIFKLAKPLATTVHTIQNNIASVQDLKLTLKRSQGNEKQLATKLYIPLTELCSFPLPYPRTVCTSDKCVRIIIVDGIRKIDYNTICHDHCYLKGVATDRIGCPELQSCEMMRSIFSTNCRVCGCGWQLHMHMTYELKEVFSQAVNENIRKNMSKEDARKAIAEHIVILQNKVEQLALERNLIIQICTKFGQFLKKSSIIPQSDPTVDYFDHLVKEEILKLKQGGGNPRMMECLQQIQRKLQEGMKDETQAKVTPVQIKELVDSLYKMPLYGHQLKSIMTVAEAANDQVMQNQEQTCNLKSTEVGTNRNKLQKMFFTDNPSE